MPVVLVVNPNSEYKVQNMAQNTLLASSSMNTGFGVHTTTYLTVYNDQFCNSVHIMWYTCTVRVTHALYIARAVCMAGTTIQS